jgi:hypothetical protein
MALAIAVAIAQHFRGRARLPTAGAHLDAHITDIAGHPSIQRSCLFAPVGDALRQAAGQCGNVRGRCRGILVQRGIASSELGMARHRACDDTWTVIDGGNAAALRGDGIRHRAWCPPYFHVAFPGFVEYHVRCLDIQPQRGRGPEGVLVVEAPGMDGIPVDHAENACEIRPQPDKPILEIKTRARPDIGKDHRDRMDIG